MRHAFLGPAAILLLGLPPVAAGGRETGPRRALVTDQAVIYYHRGDETNAQRVADAIGTNLPRIATELGAQFEGPVRLYLCTSLAEFDRLAAGSPGPWVLGQAFPERKVIVMKSMPAATTLERLVLHELTHLVFDQALGDARAAAPAWLAEGASVFLSGEWGPAHETTLAAAVGRGRLIPLDDLADDFPENPMHSGLAYAESGSFVRFLASDPATRRLARLTAALRETQDMRQATQKVFGKALEQLEREWQVGVTRSAGRQATCGDIGNLVFAATALLVIAVFVVGRIRRARRIAETEDEDEEGLYPSEEEFDT